MYGVKMKNINPIFTFSDQTFILPQYDEQGRAFVEARVRIIFSHFIAVHGTMIYMAKYLMLLMGADPLRGQVGVGWALKIESFLGPVKWHRADKEVASAVVVRTGSGIDLCGVAPGGASSPSGGFAAVGLFVLAANARVVVSAVSAASRVVVEASSPSEPGLLVGKTVLWRWHLRKL
jgi:hypothetical protein